MMFWGRALVTVINIHLNNVRQIFPLLRGGGLDDLSSKSFGSHTQFSQLNVRQMSFHMEQVWLHFMNREYEAGIGNHNIGKMHIFHSPDLV